MENDNITDWTFGQCPQGWVENHQMTLQKFGVHRTKIEMKVERILTGVQ